MLERYRKEIAPSLMSEFKHRNVMATPRLKKIVVTRR
jgi:ribosomal protein L5